MTVQSIRALDAGAGLALRVIASPAEAVARARALVPQLRARAPQADKDRRIPAANIDALREAGLFRLVSPRMFGGSQLGMAAYVEAVAEIASGCGSTGWVFAVFAGHNWTLGLFPLEAQREVFDDPDALIASVVRLGGQRPRRVAGGYLIENAAARYCSGIDHAGWVMAGAPLDGEDGGEQRYFLIPTREFEIVDDWHTAGLRGTGSKSVTLAHAFVPEHRTCSLGDMARGKAPGALLHDSPVYRAPFPQILRFQLVGVPLGLGRAALTVFAEGFGKKLGAMSPDEANEQGAVFARVSDAHGDVEAATALVLRDAAEIDALADGIASPRIDRARYVRNLGYAAQTCRRAVTSMFEAGGGSAVYDVSELQRIWRDANSAAAHNAFVRDKADTVFGRAFLGLPPSKFEPTGH